MTNNEIVLLEIFITQFSAVALGTVSVSGADWLYQRGRIRQTLHSIWVSCSITVICLPVLAWTTNVFLGSGMLSQVFVGTPGGLIFFWVYRNLRKLPAEHEFRAGSTPHPHKARLHRPVGCHITASGSWRVAPRPEPILGNRYARSLRSLGHVGKFHQAYPVASGGGRCRAPGVNWIPCRLRASSCSLIRGPADPR